MKGFVGARSREGTQGGMVGQSSCTSWNLCLSTLEDINCGGQCTAPDDWACGVQACRAFLRLQGRHAQARWAVHLRCRFTPASPAGNAAKVASVASRAACFMRPCSAWTGSPAVAGSRASSVAYRSTHAHVRKYTMALSPGCSCNTSPDVVCLANVQPDGCSLSC